MVKHCPEESPLPMGKKGTLKRLSKPIMHQYEGLVCKAGRFTQEQHSLHGRKESKGKRQDRRVNWRDALCASFLVTLLQPPEQMGESSALL